MSVGQPGVPWLTVRVKPNFERTVNQSLQTMDCETFLPITPQLRRWSDRVKEVERPLFPGYLFCRSDSNQRIPILRTPGVFRFLSVGSALSYIPDVEIESLRLLLRSGALARPFPYLQVGDPVTIEAGPLKGVDGFLQEIKKGYRIIVSINLLQRSIAADVDAGWVRAVREVKRAS
jgi:transcription antitermination factor NusG